MRFPYLHNIIFSPICQHLLQKIFGRSDKLYSLFIAEVAKQMKIRHMNQRQLAEAIGYPYASVRKFMCERYESEAIANAIAAYLNIER